MSSAGHGPGITNKRYLKELEERRYSHGGVEQNILPLLKWLKASSPAAETGTSPVILPRKLFIKDQQSQIERAFHPGVFKARRHEKAHFSVDALRGLSKASNAMGQDQFADLGASFWSDTHSQFNWHRGSEFLSALLFGGGGEIYDSLKNLSAAERRKTVKEILTHFTAECMGGPRRPDEGSDEGVIEGSNEVTGLMRGAALEWYMEEVHGKGGPDGKCFDERRPFFAWATKSEDGEATEVTMVPRVTEDAKTLQEMARSGFKLPAFCARLDHTGTNGGASVQWRSFTRTDDASPVSKPPDLDDDSDPLWHPELIRPGDSRQYIPDSLEWAQQNSLEHWGPREFKWAEERAMARRAEGLEPEGLGATKLKRAMALFHHEYDSTMSINEDDPLPTPIDNGRPMWSGVEWTLAGPAIPKGKTGFTVLPPHLYRRRADESTAPSPSEELSAPGRTSESRAQRLSRKRKSSDGHTAPTGPIGPNLSCTTTSSGATHSMRLRSSSPRSDSAGEQRRRRPLTSTMTSAGVMSGVRTRPSSAISIRSNASIGTNARTEGCRFSSQSLHVR